MITFALNNNIKTLLKVKQEMGGNADIWEQKETGFCNRKHVGPGSFYFTQALIEQ